MDEGRRKERPNLETGSGRSPSPKPYSDHGDGSHASFVRERGSYSSLLQIPSSNGTSQDRGFSNSIIDNLMPEKEGPGICIEETQVSREESRSLLHPADDQAETQESIEVWRQEISQQNTSENPIRKSDLINSNPNNEARIVNNAGNTLSERELHNPAAKFPSNLQLFQVIIDNIPTIEDLILSPAVEENVLLPTIHKEEEWLSDAQKSACTPQESDFQIGTLSATTSPPHTRFPSPLVLAPRPAMVFRRPPDELGESDPDSDNKDYIDLTQSDATELRPQHSDSWELFKDYDPWRAELSAEMSWEAHLVMSSSNSVSLTRSVLSIESDEEPVFSSSFASWIEQAVVRTARLIKQVQAKIMQGIRFQ